MQFLPHNYAEIIASVVCTVCLLYKSSVTNRWFVGFLWLTVVVELSAKQLTLYGEAKSIMYNLFNIVEFVFYLLFLSNASVHKNKIRSLKLAAVIITVFGLVNFLFFQHAKNYNHYTTLLGSVFILYACLLMYTTTLSNNTPNHSFIVQLLIVSGLLLFYAGNFFVYASYSYLSKSNPTFLVSIYKTVNGMLNVIMYGCFTVAFIVDTLYGRKPVPVIK